MVQASFLEKDPARVRIQQPFLSFCPDRSYHMHPLFIIHTPGSLLLCFIDGSHILWLQLQGEGLRQH